MKLPARDTAPMIPKKSARGRHTILNSLCRRHSREHHAQSCKTSLRRPRRDRGRPAVCGFRKGFRRRCDAATATAPYSRRLGLGDGRHRMHPGRRRCLQAERWRVCPQLGEQQSPLVPHGGQPEAGRSTNLCDRPRWARYKLGLDEGGTCLSFPRSVLLALPYGSYSLLVQGKLLRSAFKIDPESEAVVACTSSSTQVADRLEFLAAGFRPGEAISFYAYKVEETPYTPNTGGNRQV